MDKPTRHSSHVLSTISKKFFESKLPDEWPYNVPEHDYGIDYQIEIVQNEMVTGLNFSVQLKSTAENKNDNFSKVTLKSSTLGYFIARLEPIMLIQYEKGTNEAYWAWMDVFDFDLSKSKQKTYTFAISKLNKLSQLNWEIIKKHVEEVFKRRSFISGFNINEITDNLEHEAWKAYFRNEFDQSVYLFRKMIKEGREDAFVCQALAWSLYQTHNYTEALSIITVLEELNPSKEIMQTKACIIAEFGFSQMDKGKIIQAKNLFQQYLDEDSHGDMYYNYANTLGHLGRNEEAANNYQISLSKNPNKAQCWKNLGTTYYALGDHIQEMKCYDTALSINPNLEEALFSKGVTLAQIYKEYEQALRFFNQVFTKKNILSNAYVNGFLWVATCYAELGNLKTALSWLDKGLNLQGSNPFLLNLKSNLLALNWRTNPELKPQALDFFQYRIELDNDYLSIYHFLMVSDSNLEQSLQFIKDKMPLFDGITKEQLFKLGFDIEEVLMTISYLDEYHKVRKLNPPERYVNELITPFFSIDKLFWDMMDIVRCHAYSLGLRVYDDYADTKKMSEVISDDLVVYLPKLIQFLIPIDYEKEDAKEIFAFYYRAFITIFYREMGVLTGHTINATGTEKIDSLENLSETSVEFFCEGLFNELMNTLHYKRGIIDG